MTATTTDDDDEGKTVAAVDLGSNSFHMVVARRAGGGLHVVDKLRDRVAMAAGLDTQRRLAADTEERALACIERFGQRLREMPSEAVRAVGTNTLRQMRGGAAFLERASALLGHDIEIISGKEEARLVYLGVAHDIAHGVGVQGGRRLVVDIGGGSTECVVGEGFGVIECDSLYMGCVSYTKRFFDGGRVTRGRMDRARLAARRELEPIRRRYLSLGWEQAIGSSGTILAVERTLVAAGWSERHVTAKGLRRLRKRLIAARTDEGIVLPGLPPDRQGVIAGGVAVLCGVFDSLGLEVLETSQNALREGLLYDLVGRSRHADLRDDTVQRMQQRYHVDVEQAARVETVALRLLDRVAGDWDLQAPLDRKLVAWAARIHEVGLSLARSGYHKHGAYIVGNSDLPGFSREDQQALAALVRTHRRKISAALFADVPASRRRRTMRLAVLLRIARRLCRGRGAHPKLPAHVAASGARIRLEFEEDWRAANPLTAADLLEEAGLLAALDIELQVR